MSQNFFHSTSVTALHLVGQWRKPGFNNLQLKLLSRYNANFHGETSNSLTLFHAYKHTNTMWGVTIVFLGLSNSQLQLFFIYFVSSIHYHRKKNKKNRNESNTTTKYSQLFSMCTCPTRFHDILFSISG